MTSRLHEETVVPMASWRERILEDLAPGVASVTLAADPDDLLLDEEVLEEVRRRGFQFFTFEDPVAFRLAHEMRSRHPRVSGNAEGANAELLLRFDHDDLASIPYDLLQVGRPLRFGLSELFPELSCAVLATLDTADLNAVDDAQRERRPKALGEKATKDFVLQHVFGVRATEIKSPADLLQILLRRHYREIRLPRPLDERLVAVLRRNEAFASWPLETIVPEREAFFAFLQERWPVFLDGSAGEDGQIKAERPLILNGPLHLPFDHADVRVYIDNLFLEGKLVPVPHAPELGRHGDWVSVGIRSDLEVDRLRRLEKLLGHVDRVVPQSGVRHPEWLSFAWLWAELGVLWWSTLAPARQQLSGRLTSLRRRVDEAFRGWVESRYAGLHNLPPDPPVMVHHLPRYLARRLEDATERRIALVVVDGLALDQWLVLRDVLGDQRPTLGFRSDALFAWAPTITSVSRQSIFAGTPPFYFESSIHTTEKEPSLWHGFWAEHGLSEHEVEYLKGGTCDSVDELRDRASVRGLRVLGVVLNKVDDIMHGMELGVAGMHNQVRQWAEEGQPVAIVESLLEAGFAVFLTSDHGNVEARGYGRPSEGALVSTRGKRARVYSDTTLRNRVLEQFPDAVAWPGPGLPTDCHALLAPGRSAFAHKGDRIVGHGGVSLEELVVPLIEIRRKAE